MDRSRRFKQTLPSQPGPRGLRKRLPDSEQRQAVFPPDRRTLCVSLSPQRSGTYSIPDYPSPFNIGAARPEATENRGLPPERTEDIKREFYSFFRADAHVYPEAEQVLAALKSRGIPTATLSDVAYGMDNIYALDDIRPLLRYIDLPWTSNDTGFRKPSGKGLLKIAAEWRLPVSDVAFVGDERKDMDCARNAGAAGILVNRTGEAKEYGQAFEIKDLSGILNLL